MERFPAKTNSRSLRIAAICFLFAFVLGIPGAIMRFTPEYSAFLVRNMIEEGITDPASLRTWQLIHHASILLACLGPSVMTTGFLIIRKKKFRGVSFLGNAAQYLLWGLYCGGIAAVALFAFRFIRYILLNVSDPSGVLKIYSMIISEALMVSLSAFLFFLTKKFLNCCIDASTSIAYTLATGNADTCSIPCFTATGFLLLAIAGIVLSIDRLFTITIIQTIRGLSYKVFLTSHPLQLGEIGSLCFGSVANIAMWHWLRRYKQAAEQYLFEVRNRK